MPRIEPFHGVRYDFQRVPVGRGPCPPYDVIPPAQAARLRRMPWNAVHLELPEGKTDARYRRAAGRWRAWRRDGVLVSDATEAYYVVEQTFVQGGRRRRRTGILASLTLDREGLRRVVPHERTLSKPKRDRRKLLEALRVNTSPVFLLFPDPRGLVRRIAARVLGRRAALLAGGRAVDGVDLRLARLDDSEDIRRVRAALRNKTLLIADGHHRFEVSRRCGLRTVLCYLCAEEDPGLVVLPTHRVLADARAAEAAVGRLCRVTPCASLARLERALARHPSPRAFGLASARGFALAAPRRSSLRELRSRLGVEWLAKRLLAGLDPHEIRYTHDPREAAEWAGREGLALIVKPVSVREIRRAVARLGLLPQKTTYFHPKVEAGLVFKEAQ